MVSNVPPAKQFKLLYFASASSYTKKKSDILEAPLPLSELFSSLEKLYPGIGDRVLSSSAVTINMEYVEVNPEEAKESSYIIKEGDEVAIIPPVSSG